MFSAPDKTAAQAGENAAWLPALGTSRRSAWGATLSRKVVNASEKFLSQRDDDSRRASHVAQPVLVLVLDRLAETLLAEETQGDERAAKLQESQMDVCAVLVTERLDNHGRTGRRQSRISHPDREVGLNL